MISHGSAQYGLTATMRDDGRGKIRQSKGAGMRLSAVSLVISKCKPKPHTDEKSRRNAKLVRGSLPYLPVDLRRGDRAGPALKMHA
jgi:hypothetical protein